MGITGLKNIYIYSGNNIFVFLAGRARRHNNRDYGFIKYNFIKYKRNVKPMKKLEKSIAVCLHVAIDIRIDWQTSKHFAKNRPAHLHVSNPIYNTHCPLNVTKLVYSNNRVNGYKFRLAQNVAEYYG